MWAGCRVVVALAVASCLAAVLIHSLLTGQATPGAQALRTRSASRAALKAEGFSPVPLPVVVPSIGKSCDCWPDEKLADVFESLGIDITGMGWRCLHASRVERLERDRGEVRAGVELSPAQCKAWCLKQHPRELFLKNDAAGWCCEWRPDNAGECAWSDGVARFTPLARQCQPSGGGTDGETCVRSLAFELCELAEGFRRLGNGRCLRHRDVIIGQFRANSRNHCSVLCAQQAENVVSGGLTCTGFAYEPDALRLPNHRKQHLPTCILLSMCKLRPHPDAVYEFLLRPEAIPPLPALT